MIGLILKSLILLILATTTQVSNVRQALQGRSSRTAASTLLDIGSGDGRIVISAARDGFQATGVELNR